MPSRGRARPYTDLGLRRLACWRCGRRPCTQQWQVCADGNVYRPICTGCDVALNALVLRWAGDPQAEAKIAAYRPKGGAP